MKINFKKKCEEENPVFLADWLVKHVDLSKIKIKNIIGFGGVWIRKTGKSKKERIKKIKTLLKAGEFVEFNYDSNLSFCDESLAYEVYSAGEFGVWYKPAGMLADGSPYADRGSLSYLIKKKSKKCFLIQRLDREVGGLMLVAYSKKMAAFFSKELLDGRIGKFYQAQVIGLMSEDGEINEPLDSREASTLYRVHKTLDGTTLLNVEIKTGRFHQIRRHFEMIHHPLLGDPRYGEGNKNRDGLRLVSHCCEIFHPKERKRLVIELPLEKRLF